MMQSGRLGMMQPPVILLKEGTDTSQGKGQLLSNIGACLSVVSCVAVSYTHLTLPTKA